MGALYEDVEKFFGDIFAFYGKILARYPVVFILLSLLTSSLLGMGLLSLKYETHVDKLYTPMGSPAFKDQAKLELLFPEQTSKAFYAHQQLFLDTHGSILIQTKDPLEKEEGSQELQMPLGKGEGDGEGEEGATRNVLTQDILADAEALYRDILTITLQQDDRGFRYEDLCASRQGACVVDGEVLLEQLKHNICLSVNHSYPYLQGASGRLEDLRSVLSDITITDAGCMRARAFRLRFNLRHDTPHQRDLGLIWEKKFLQRVALFRSDHTHVSYSASESLDIELTEHVGEDTKFFALTIIIMILYATFVSSGGNWVSTRVLLAQAGVLAALLAILASFGLLSMCGMTFVDICGVMPFLVLGVGVDDMFILMSGWRQTDVTKDIEERISETLRSSAISVTITSLTDLLAFCIGATSPFLSVKNFCIYTGVAVLLCYINQLTFFGGCLVLHARRVESSRHCLTCMKTSSRRELKQEGHSKVHILCCSGHPPKKPGEDDSLCEKIPSSFLPKLLLRGPTKTLIIMGFIVYISVSAWGASQIKTGLKMESVVPESSYLHEFYTRERELFPSRGAYIMFVVNKPVKYTEVNVHTELKKVFKKAMDSNFLDITFRISWLEKYMEYRKNMSLMNIHNDFIGILRRDFLVKHKEYEHDLLFNEDKTEIIASRVYVKSMLFADSTSEGDLMLNMRDIAKNSTLPLIAYGPEFIYYEHYVSILKNTLLAVGVAIIGMLFVALMFIPHPISITCVTLTMVTIVLGMFGFMHFWGLALSAITTVQIILSVGFCVDFTVHISHAFMTATGKNRNERVVAALEKVGVPILNGAVSSILGILMLGFASSYIFKSFFKTMLLVIVLGVAHSLLFLPVMLSFVGPRRTSKPRVFIPINAPSTTSARVLNDMMSEYARHSADHVHHRNQRAAPHQPPPLTSEQKNGREHIELLQLDVPRDVPPRENSAPAMLHLTDIELIDKDSEHGSHSDDGHSGYYGDGYHGNSTGETRASTLPRAHRVVIEQPPEEEIRLAQFVPRADRTPSPLLSKPQVEKREKRNSLEMLERWTPFGRHGRHAKDDDKKKEDKKKEDKKKGDKGKRSEKRDSSTEDRDREKKS